MGSIPGQGIKILRAVWPPKCLSYKKRENSIGLKDLLFIFDLHSCHPFCFGCNAVIMRALLCLLQQHVEFILENFRKRKPSKIDDQI